MQAKNPHSQQLVNKISALLQENKPDPSLQKIIRILQLEPSNRHNDQLRLLQNHFEMKYAYVQYGRQLFRRTRKIKNAISEETYLLFFREVKYEYFSEFELIFNIGELGRKMYFILQGEAAILLPSDNKNNAATTNGFLDHLKNKFPEFRLLTTKREGEYFGEIALEQRIPRTATVLAKTSCHFGVLSFDSYQKILAQFQVCDLCDYFTCKQLQQLNQNQQYFSQIPLFQNWKKKDILTLLHSCEERTIQTNAIIYKRNSITNYVYLIKKGEVLIERWKIIENGNTKQLSRVILANLSCGQLFGDFEIDFNQLKNNLIRQTQATARVDTVVYAIRIHHFISCLQQSGDLEVLKQQIADKYHLLDKIQEKEAAFDDVDIFRKIDFSEVGNIYFQNMKKNNEIHQIQNEIQKFKKIRMKKLLNEKLEKLEDPEISIKNMFSEKFSFTVPFRFHPLNQEQDVITSNHIRKKQSCFVKPKFEEKRSTIQEILYKTEKENQRRLYLQVKSRFDTVNKSEKAVNKSPSKSHYYIIKELKRKNNSEPNFKHMIKNKQLINPGSIHKSMFQKRKISANIEGTHPVKEQDFQNLHSSRQLLFADPLTSRRTSTASQNLYFPDSICQPLDCDKRKTQFFYKFQIDQISKNGQKQT